MLESVDISNSSDECDGAGDNGNEANVVLDCWEDAGDFGDSGTVSDLVDEDSGSLGAELIPVGRPWAARALTTASQPCSKVFMRSLSSSFSRSLVVIEDVTRPARSCLFSSSSSATLRSR